MKTRLAILKQQLAEALAANEPLHDFWVFLMVSGGFAWLMFFAWIATKWAKAWGKASDWYDEAEQRVIARMDPDIAECALEPRTYNANHTAALSIVEMSHVPQLEQLEEKQRGVHE